MMTARVSGIPQAREQREMTGQRGRHRREERGAAPHDGHRLVEEQDQPEGGEHLVQVVTLVERAQCDHLDEHADGQRRDEPEEDAQQEGARPRVGRRREVGSHHVERPVGEVDEVHDAEHQRQPAAIRTASRRTAGR
jgi:hypothetical protein